MKDNQDIAGSTQDMDNKLDNLAIYLTAFAFQNDPKLIHDEIVHKVTAILATQRAKDKAAVLAGLSDTFKVFFDTFEAEIDQQEFMLDESEWMSLIQVFRLSEKKAIDQAKQAIEQVFEG